MSMSKSRLWAVSFVECEYPLVILADNLKEVAQKVELYEKEHEGAMFFTPISVQYMNQDVTVFNDGPGITGACRG